MKYAAAVSVMFLSLTSAMSAGNDSAPDTSKLRLIRVPMTRQATDYTCGVAAVQSLLGYYGEDARERELYAELQPDSKMGTNTHNIAALFRKRGFEVAVTTGALLSDLKKALDDAKPVIVTIQAWGDKPDYTKEWEDGHFAVAIGYDKKNIYFMDPSTLGHYTYIPSAEFLARWHDYEKEGKLIRFMLTASKNAPVYNPDRILRME